MTADRAPANDDSTPADAFEGTCPVCGESASFVRDSRPTRESYGCPHCRGSLRYQGQARVIVDHFAREGSASIAALVRERDFQCLHIWEPGEIGPFRRYLRPLAHYEQSVFEPGVRPGEIVNGLRCENLMATTFKSESLDLIVTSDVFEHVRDPDVGFREMFRVLRPGGVHIFSIPVTAPMAPTTVPRVEISGDDDVFLLEPRYHKTHLVYNDFGRDLLDRLREIGFRADVVSFDVTNPNAARLLTFSTVKPG
jgi:SAM-dependent methyltransferase